MQMKFRSVGSAIPAKYIVAMHKFLDKNKDAKPPQVISIMKVKFHATDGNPLDDWPGDTNIQRLAYITKLRKYTRQAMIAKSADPINELLNFDLNMKPATSENGALSED